MAAPAVQDEAQVTRLRTYLDADATGKFLTPLQKAFVLKRLCELGDREACLSYEGIRAFWQRLVSEENNSVAREWLATLGEPVA